MPENINGFANYSTMKRLQKSSGEQSYRVANWTRLWYF